MKLLLTTLLALALLAVTPLGAQPIRDNGPSHVFGLEYTSLFRGQTITESATHAGEQSHTLSFAYFPLPIVGLRLGGGVGAFSVSPNNRIHFDGNLGPSLIGGVSICTPAFIKRSVQILGGLGAGYFHSTDKAGFRYSAKVWQPYAGARLWLTHHGCVEVGAKGHWVDGNMENIKTDSQYGPFSNPNILRGYGKLSLNSPIEGVYVTGTFEASPQFSTEWDNGPYEAAVGLSVGVLIRKDKKNEEIKTKSSKVFPAYQELENRAKIMEQKLKEQD